MIRVEHIKEFRHVADLHDLSDAAEAAVEDGGGFGWVAPPPRHIMESYWKGVLMVPERKLFVGRLDGVIAGAAQLVQPPKANEAQAGTGQILAMFVAPWARGHGLGRLLLTEIEKAARDEGFYVLNLDIRETQKPAIHLIEALGFQQWGQHPYYAMVKNEVIPGRFYCKKLRDDLE